MPIDKDIRRKRYKEDKIYRNRVKEAVLKAASKRIDRFKEFKKTLSCCTCGEKESCCLDFHHINPSEKKYTISNKIDKFSFEKLKKEIDKCIVVCANCHRKIHAGILEPPGD